MGITRTRRPIHNHYESEGKIKCKDVEDRRTILHEKEYGDKDINCEIGSVSELK